MSIGLRELLDQDLDEALERQLAPRLSRFVQSRAGGHCARVSDIYPSLAVRLARRIGRALGSAANVRVLGQPPAVPADVAVTSAKLVELRNPEADQERPPLLVFIPPGTRTSAEDSFDVATFEEVVLGDVYAELGMQLLADLPAHLGQSVRDLFDVLDTSTDGKPWPHAASLEKARYLLTVQLNEADPEAAGAAVYELGLIPDFELFTDLTQVRTRAARNLRQMRILTEADRPERQRVIRLGLTDSAFRSRLADFAVAVGLENPRLWTRRIVVDRANWYLAFQRWPLPHERTSEAVRVMVGDLSELPRAGSQPEHSTHPLLSTLTGQPFLVVDKQGPSQLPIQFDVEPDPQSVLGLSSFLIELMSAEPTVRTGASVSVRVGRTGKRTYKAVLKKLRTADLDQGWHFIQVTPYDAEGAPLRLAPTDSDARPAGQSDWFYVLTDEDDLPDPPPGQRVVRRAGFTQALREKQFDARTRGDDWRSVVCRSVGWKDGSRAAQQTLQVSFGSHGRVEIPLASDLTRIQHAMLAEPDRPGQWRLPVQAGRAGSGVRADTPWPEVDAGALHTFLEARRSAFKSIRASDALVVEACDLLDLKSPVRAYADAYGQLLRLQLLRTERADESRLPQALLDLATLLRIDTVAVDYADVLGMRSELTLVAPTHPLRLLWLVTWASLGRSWLERGTENEASVMATAGESLLQLALLGFPFVVPHSGSRMAVTAGDLTPYWGVCLPADVPDPQRLLSGLAAALKLPSPHANGGDVSGKLLADRVERYLRLHPYVTTLTINAVNPGRGDLLAEMLVDLQGRKGLNDIRYDLRLFSAEPDSPALGEALADLLRGEWGTTAAAEAFCTPTGTSTSQKLAVSIRPLSEFRSSSQEHLAHLTLLFDAFGGERFDTARANDRHLLPVHGLRQDVDIDYVENEDLIAWHKEPRHGFAQPIAGSAELTDVLASLPAAISAATCAVATGQVGTQLVPRLTLSLESEGSTLLHQAHRTGDWVITVDRTLGVEYFDSAGGERRPDYIIDFDTDGAGLGHHIMISSRSVDELQALLRPVVEQHDLDIDDRHVGTFFDQLRLLSGRLAFKIASATATQRTEVIGLALARLYLDYQGVLQDQILVPLDAHLELYRDARRRADEVKEAVGLQRTDLALFGLDARRQTITCRLVEVKSYSSIPNLSAYEQLKDRIREQLERSASVLAENFDPYLAEPDRPDRPVRNAQFSDLLRWYLDRAVRYRIMHPDAAREARWLLERLDYGYRLEFTHSGLIFDLGESETSRETDGGVEFHRIGRDLARELLDAIPTEPGIESGLARATLTSEALSQTELSLPRLGDAVFRAPARSHALPDAEPLLPDDPDSGSEPPDASDPSTGELEVNQTTPQDTPGESVVPLAEAAGSATAVSSARGSSPVGTTAKTTEDPGAIYLGSTRSSPQYGILGEVASRRVALDLNETHTISLFGLQGYGKSYTLGTIIEAATLAVPGVGQLPNPLATIVFHYSQTLDYAPEFTSMVAPNDDADQVQRLRERYGVEPTALTDVVMLVPADQLEQRRGEYTGIKVLPLKFGSAELRAEHWRFLMGAVGNQSTYIRQLQRIMKAHRRNLRLDAIRDGVEQSALSDNLKQLALQRLDLAAEYIDDEARVKDLVRPGRVIIVDLRDEFIEKDEALGLFVVLMQLFAEAQDAGQRFNKLVVFDEAHKYIESPDLIDGLVQSVREMRHKGMSVLVASQDPPSVPVKLIELSNHVILHRFTSPTWLRHLQKANAALTGLTSAKLAGLAQGEAYVWSGKASDAAFNRGAVKVVLRPRLSRHGGGTKTAVE